MSYRGLKRWKSDTQAHTRTHTHTHTHTSRRQIKITFLDILDYSEHSDTNISIFFRENIASSARKQNVIKAWRIVNFCFLRTQAFFLSKGKDKLIISSQYLAEKTNCVELTVLSKNVPHERTESIGEIQESPRATPFKLLLMFPVFWAW